METCLRASTVVRAIFMHNDHERSTLEEALLVYAEFRILEGQAVEWSKEHSFKCNCQH